MTAIRARLARSLMVRASELADLPGVPAAIECGIRVEAILRSAVHGVTERLCASAGLPTAREVSALRERASLARFRLDTLRAVLDGSTPQRSNRR